MPRTVRTLAARLLAILAAVCAIGIVTAGTASAGGPTSVLLASPYADSAAALYVSDNDYARLSDLLGATDVPTASTDPHPATAGSSPYVTATWLIHDVSVWRIDRIFFVGDDVWVVSETSSGDGMLTGEGMFPSQTGNAGAVWHRPIDAAALTALLTAHGLTVGSPHPISGGATAGASAPSTGQAAPVSGTRPEWPWGIGGLVVGLVIGAAFVRFAAGGREPTEPTEPARMLPVA